MKKAILKLILPVLLFACVFGGCRIRSTEDYYKVESRSETAYGTVTFSIRFDSVFNSPLYRGPEEGTGKFLPESGFFLKPAEFALTEGETAYSLLVYAAKRDKIRLEVKGASATSSLYVEGIGHLYELEYGPLSGWMYRVNGLFPHVSADRYVLKDGDVVEWVYSCDLGRDVGDHWEEETGN